jgi:hypothetical protein
MEGLGRGPFVVQSTPPPPTRDDPDAVPSLFAFV